MDSSPSGGLLENPEDAAYYDWHLVDSKTSPYATFRFFYRSWKTLSDLSLVPPMEARTYAASVAAVKQSVRPTTPVPEETGSGDEDGSPFAYGTETLDGSVFDDSLTQTPRGATTPPPSRKSSGYELKSPPVKFPSSNPERKHPQPSKRLRDLIPDSPPAHP